jgi:hypothetical protein
LQTIPSGNYILVLYGKDGMTTKKVVKNWELQTQIFYG